MAELSLSNVINISLSSLPQGLTKYKTNNIALFVNTTTGWGSPDPYIVATSAADVEAVLGTNAVGSYMARALFTPAFNLRTGEGSLYVFPYNASSATAASTITTTISTVTTFSSTVTNGSLTVDIDGTDYKVTGLNFSGVKTVSDIVKVLAAANLDCDISAQEGKIEFISRLYGSDSSISIKATSDAPSGQDVYTLLDGANQVTTAGTNASGTTLSDAVANAEEMGFFGGVITTQALDNASIIANAAALQGKDHIYYEVTRSLKNIAVLGASLKSAGDSKTRLLAYSRTQRRYGTVDAKSALATYATIASSTNYTGTDTCITMNLKTLTGILPDLNLNQTYVTSAKTNGVDIYGSIEGLGVVFSNNNNGYTDDITSQLWLKKDLEVQGFNYLRKTNTKIPQTEVGMTGLKQAYEQSLIQGVRNGYIGTGVGWGDDVAIPFGNPEDFRRNILEKGYYIYSLPISQQPSADREERKAPLIQIAVKAAGAIHSSNVIVNIAA